MLEMRVSPFVYFAPEPNAFFSLMPCVQPLEAARNVNTSDKISHRNLSCVYYLKIHKQITHIPSPGDVSFQAAFVCSPPLSLMNTPYVGYH